jgi:hypothetical protein
MTTTTRRFAADGPGATGSVAPWPTTSSENALTPWASKKLATAVALASESA